MLRWVGRFFISFEFKGSCFNLFSYKDFLIKVNMVYFRFFFFYLRIKSRKGFLECGLELNLLFIRILVIFKFWSLVYSLIFRFWLGKLFIRLWFFVFVFIFFRMENVFLTFLVESYRINWVFKIYFICYYFFCDCFFKFLVGYYCKFSMLFFMLWGTDLFYYRYG